MMSDSSLVDHAFKEIYPTRELIHKIKVNYSGRFKPYNANVRHTREFLHFNLSKEWKNVSKEIQMGLIQSLLVKIFKGTPNTGYRDLYESFVKNLSKYSTAINIDPILKQSFDRVNENFFNGLLEIPNLEWGTYSKAKLGSYEYQTNTVSISRILENGSNHAIDYIMYHELLHKKLKFTSSASGRNLHHSTEFRKQEKKYPNIKLAEQEIHRHSRKSRTKANLFSKWIK